MDRGLNVYSCIIFDMDGTLTNTNRLIFDSFNHIVESYGGARMSDKDIVKLFGPPEEGALEVIVGKSQLDAAMRSYLAYYKEQHDRLASLHEGMDVLLRALREKGVILAVFTGKGTHTARITLEAYGLSDLFAAVITGNDVKAHKPSGEGIRTVLASTGISAAETLMVGDSVSDIKAARDAGIDVASVLWNSYAVNEVMALHPDYIFHNVAEFSSWLLSVTKAGSHAS